MIKQLIKAAYLTALVGLTAMSAGCNSIAKKEEPPKREVQYENAQFESMDRGKSDPLEDRTVYYKIFLDKELTAKTPSGLFFQRKKLDLHLSPGRYLFFAERWVLEESAEGDVPEYKRANNVWQMKPIYIDIPENPQLFKMIFGIDHDNKEFYFKIEGLLTEVPAPIDSEITEP